MRGFRVFLLLLLFLFAACGGAPATASPGGESGTANALSIVVYKSPT